MAGMNRGYQLFRGLTEEDIRVGRLNVKSTRDNLGWFPGYWRRLPVLPQSQRY